MNLSGYLFISFDKYSLVSLGLLKYVPPSFIGAITAFSILYFPYMVSNYLK